MKALLLILSLSLTGCFVTVSEPYVGEGVNVGVYTPSVYTTPAYTNSYYTHYNGLAPYPYAWGNGWRYNNYRANNWRYNNWNNNWHGGGGHNNWGGYN
jgi:hypothetical protein